MAMPMDGLIPFGQGMPDLVPINQASERQDLFEPSEPMSAEFIRPEDDTRKAAKEALERYEYYLPKLSPVWQKWVKHWRLYTAARKNTRSAKESWRSWVHVPYPFSGIQTTTAAFLDVFLSVNPPVKPSAIGPEDLMSERKIERLIDYQMRGVEFPGELELALIEMFVQGIFFRKSNWINDTAKIWVHPSQEEITQFEESVVAAIEAGMPMPPAFEAGPEMIASGQAQPGGGQVDTEQQLEMFEAWRQQAIANGFNVPEPPVPGPQEIIRYRGTGFTRVSAFDMVYDPAVAPWDKCQKEFVYQRSVKSVRWLKERARKDDVSSPFDPAKLEEALGTGQGSKTGGDVRLNTYQEEILGMMGVTSSQEEKPGLTGDNRLVEVITCWAPGTDFPYRVMVNRHEDLVNRLKITPYWHSDVPMIVGTNNRVPGMMPAMGELWQPERLYYEMNTLRGLRIDGILLAILPMWTRLREAGMTELAKKLIPGMIIEASRHDALQQASKIEPPMQAFTEIDKIKDDIDVTNATMPNVRGSVSSGSGTTATESNRAFENAMARTTQRIIRFEGEMSRWVKHSLFNWYQFAKPQEKLRVGGDPPLDPFAIYRRKDFLQAIDMDYRFAGARTSVNTAEEVAQLKDLLITAINAGIKTANIDAIFGRIVELVARDKFQFTFPPQAPAPPESEDTPDNTGGAGEGGGPPEEEAPAPPAAGA